jgi:hypothetical protein
MIIKAINVVFVKTRCARGSREAVVDIYIVSLRYQEPEYEEHGYPEEYFGQELFLCMLWRPC